MTWAKLDDTFHSHPKIRTAWARSRASIGLHAMAISYAAMYEQDGLVPAWFVEGVLPSERERQSALDALTAAGLWRPTDDGEFVIHDYLDYNPSRSELATKRAKDAARKREERRH